MFRLIAINFSLLSSTSSCELSEREVTSPSNLEVVRALLIRSLIFIINFLCILGLNIYEASNSSTKKYNRHFEDTQHVY